MKRFSFNLMLEAAVVGNGPVRICLVVCCGAIIRVLINCREYSLAWCVPCAKHPAVLATFFDNWLCNKLGQQSDVPEIPHAFDLRKSNRAMVWCDQVAALISSRARRRRY